MGRKAQKREPCRAPFEIFEKELSESRGLVQFLEDGVEFLFDRLKSLHGFFIGGGGGIATRAFFAIAFGTGTLGALTFLAVTLGATFFLSLIHI